MLAIQSRTVIGRISVAHQKAGKILPEDRPGRLRRPMPVDVEECEVLIACKPDIMTHPVVSPRGSVSMHPFRGPDFFANILVKRTLPVSPPADSKGIYIEYNDVGYAFTGVPTLTMGDIEIGGNTIDTAPTGIETYFDNLYTEDVAKVTIGELSIHDNTLTNISGYGIYAYYYNYNDDPGQALLTIGAPAIVENTISGNTAPGDGIYLEVENATNGIDFAMPVISRNTISGFDHGIYIEDLEAASMSCNYIDNNTLAGIRFNTDGTDFAVNSNSITGNTVGISVDNGQAAVIDAEDNWWGDKFGPAACATCNGVNPGDVGTVDYTPWLTYEPQKSRCGRPFPWVMFIPATTGMSPQL